MHNERYAARRNLKTARKCNFYNCVRMTTLQNDVANTMHSECSEIGHRARVISSARCFSKINSRKHNARNTAAFSVKFTLSINIDSRNVFATAIASSSSTLRQPASCRCFKNPLSIASNRTVGRGVLSGCTCCAHGGGFFAALFRAGRTISFLGIGGRDGSCVPLIAVTIRSVLSSDS